MNRADKDGLRRKHWHRPDVQRLLDEVDRLELRERKLRALVGEAAAMLCGATLKGTAADLVRRADEP